MAADLLFCVWTGRCLAVSKKCRCLGVSGLATLRSTALVRTVRLTNHCAAADVLGRGSKHPHIFHLGVVLEF